MSAASRVDVEQLDGMDACVLITVTGDLDLASAHAVAAVGMLAISDAQTTEAIIDMSRIGFIDSTGLKALINIRNAAADSHRAMRLRGPSAQAVKLLKITGVDPLFDIEVTDDLGRC
jgi:anti-sigma B factor antagonist